jgi:hypothetical protein
MTTPLIESFYPRIGQAAFDAVPFEFSDLWVSSEIDEDVSGTALFVKTKDGAYRFSGQTQELDGLMCQMREAFVSEGKKPWSTATLWMSSEGKFSIDFGYGDIDLDYEAELNRRAAWVRKYLGEGAVVDYTPWS